MPVMPTAAEPGRRVLLVTVEFRAPPVSGRERRYWQHVLALRPSADVGVLLLDRSTGPQGRPDGLGWWRRSTEPWRDDQVGWLRRPDGHPAYGQVPPPALAALDEALQEFDPDVVVVCGLWLHGHLDRLRRGGRHVVLDAADVEGGLQEGLAQVASRGERALLTALARRVAVIEAAAAASVDQIWACSEHDAGALRARYPEAAPVRVVPNTVDARSLRRPPSAGRPAAPGVLYPATLRYGPNQAAAMALVEDIHPLVRRRFPSATLHLVGPGAGPALQAAAERAPGVTVIGPVADMRPWLWESTVLAAPLHIGSGTRIKILEAFAAGLPVVTTAKGAEGLDVTDGQHVLLAESPGQFADAVAFLHADADAAAALAARARGLVGARYATEAAQRAVASALARAPAQ